VDEPGRDDLLLAGRAGDRAGGGVVPAGLAVGVAVRVVATQGRVPLAAITLTALAAFEAVTGLPGAALQTGHARSSARRITEVLDAPDPVAHPDAPAALPAGPVTVTLRGAQVRYDPTGPPAVDGIDLDLAPGRRVALVGPAGAGKSTVAAVLFRFADLSAGTVTLNGRDLAAYDPDEVHAVIGGCPQDPHIFDATIRANLLLARPGATDAELAGAARAARLLDWIESLPLGWETPAGTRGEQLSGGQRQRLALARALLASPALLVLEHGRVAERGTHDELIRARGSYQRMCELSRAAGHQEPGSALAGGRAGRRMP
jgi:ATP-binding cassette, subfamily C, bacterial CydC